MQPARKSEVRGAWKEVWAAVSSLDWMAAHKRCVGGRQEMNIDRTRARYSAFVWLFSL